MGRWTGGQADSAALLTSEQPGDGQVYADRLLGHFVGTGTEDVFAHVVICGFAVEGLIIAAHQRFVALHKGKEQNFHLGGGGFGGRHGHRAQVRGQRSQMGPGTHTLSSVFKQIISLRF